MVMAGTWCWGHRQNRVLVSQQERGAGVTSERGAGVTSERGGGVTSERGGRVAAAQSVMVG